MNSGVNSKKRLHSESSIASETATEGGLFELILFAVLFVLVFGVVARADEASSLSANVSAPSSPTWKPGSRLLIETSRGTNDADREYYSGLYRLSGSLAHVPSAMSVSARLGYVRAYTYQQDDGTDGNFENVLLGVTKKLSAGKDFHSPLVDTVSIGLRNTLPANRNDQKATFRGAVGPMLALEKKFWRISLAQTFVYYRQFFEFDIRDDGTVNSPDRFISTTETSFNITDRVAFSGAFLLDRSVSFQGVGRTSHLASLGFDYEINKYASLSVGVSTGRAALTSDGQAEVVYLYDSSAAETFLDLVIQI